MIDFDYTDNDFIHIFDFNNYNNSKLLSEAHSRNYEPFEVPMDEKESDPSWFELGKDVHMDNWTQARFFGIEEDGSDDLNNYPETQRLTKYFANIIGTKDIRPRFYRLEPNTSVPEHIDHNTKCGINIILSENAGPVEFIEVGKFDYHVALLNTTKLHSVPPYPKERILLKLSIMDLDFETVKRRLITMKPPFKILKPIPLQMHEELVKIYNRCKTHILHFYASDPVLGEMNCDQIWAETEEDQKWIHENILKYYGITIDNVADFDYSNKDFFQVKNDPSFWQKGFTPPYGGWSRNGINFTRWVAGEAKCMLHDDKAPHVPYKINIPVVNTDLGTIFYPEFKKEFNYKTDIHV